MNVTRERLTFEFLDELYREHELDPLPSHWVPLDVIWERVTKKYGKGRLSSELASAAFNQLYAQELINVVKHPDGKKMMQLNQSGVAAYHAAKASFKSEKRTKKEYNLKLLGLLVALAALLFAVIKFVFFRQ